MESSSSEEDPEDGTREMRAAKQAMILMLGMPYLLLGTFGLLIYRGLRKKPPGATPAADLAEGGKEDLVCPSPADGSSPAP